MQTRHGVIHGQQLRLTRIDLREAAFDLRCPCIFGVCIDVAVEALNKPRRELRSVILTERERIVEDLRYGAIHVERIPSPGPGRDAVPSAERPVANSWHDATASIGPGRTWTDRGPS